MLRLYIFEYNLSADFPGDCPVLKTLVTLVNGGWFLFRPEPPGQEVPGFPFLSSTHSPGLNYILSEQIGRASCRERV